MQIVQSIIAKAQKFKRYGIAVLFVALIFQIPFPQPKATISNSQLPTVKATTETAPQIQSFTQASVATQAQTQNQDQTQENTSPLIADFFGQKTPESLATAIVKSKENFITTRPTYSASLQVIKKNEDIIRQKAQQYSVPADVAIGVGLLENGGSETAQSKAGALGVFQLMPSTARNLGLTVNATVDQRRNPEMNIDAGMRYLRSNYQRFGDWGLATWAYHAGEGNVAKAVQLYFKEQTHVSLAGLSNIDQMKNYLDYYHTTVYDILSSVAVRNFTNRLHDDSAAYPYKVLATADLFKN